MRILIDARVLDRVITGTGRFLLNILAKLPEHDTNNEYFLLSENILKNYKINYNFYKHVKIKTSYLPPKIYSVLALNLIIPKLLKENNIDIFLQPNILIPSFNRGNVKYIAVIHDIIPKIYKNYYPLSYRLYLSAFLGNTVKNTHKIITVSSQSKEDLIKYFAISPQKIDVAYNVADMSFSPLKLGSDEEITFKRKLNLPDKFLLYVGAIEKRKNITGILKTLDLIREKGSKLHLVIIGKPGFGFDSIHPEIIKRKDCVRYFPYITDQDLKIIYNLAFSFFFPSFYEGFGIPPLEAMQSGIPVLASNNSSLYEVVNQGGLLHSPDDYHGFAEDILKLENSNDFYVQCRNRALIQSRKFNISSTTEKLVEIINQFNSYK